MHIDLFTEEENCLVIENDDLPVCEKFTFEEFTNYFVEKPEDLGFIKVLIVGAFNGRPLMEMFRNTIKKIPII